MARETRQRISYVLPLPNTSGGHRLGVNGLAIDPERSILYSGGRDGLICAWNLKSSTSTATGSTASHRASDGRADPTRRPETATLSTQVQAHSHWVNDILLAQSNSALVSASSDVTVKLWRPQSETDKSPATIGVHSDYVKCLASPGAHSDWIASGGLDHHIRLWDLYGGGERLHINVGEGDKGSKSSVYALSAQGGIVASGGPESIVKLWDTRNGRRITSFVGHTDNIRDILLNQDGDMVMTASSDQSIKVWSVTAGRCMYTLTMHNDSVWSLYSDHPKLELFYSSDRAGQIAKTDVRRCDDMDEGLSIAIGKEQQGVAKVIAANDCVWTATSTSSINCWHDVDTTGDIQLPEAFKPQRMSSIASRARAPSSPRSPTATFTANSQKPKIPFASVLRISTNAPMPGQNPKDAEVSTIYSGISARKVSEAFLDHENGIVTPYHDLPLYTIEGQYGLIKQVILNDRRRVLTLDTTGEVCLWDLLHCSLIKACGKRHLEDVRPEVDEPVSVANWCSIDIHTGRIMVTLEKNFCFDAESYADELGLEDSGSVKDDQRSIVNLGKWILRSLFARLIDQEIERDVIVRRQAYAKMNQSRGISRPQAPISIQLPKTSLKSMTPNLQDDVVTSKSIPAAPVTPGSTIATASPQTTAGFTAIPASQVANGENRSNGAKISLERRSEEQSEIANKRISSDEQADGARSPGPQSEGTADGQPATSPSDTKEEKTGGSLFGKKFRMTFPKKLGRSSNEVKTSVADEKAEDVEQTPVREDKSNAPYLQGTIDDIRAEYEGQLLGYSSYEPESAIIPRVTTDNPPLDPPQSTTIIIQEESSDLGAVVDRYRGSVGTVGQDTDIIKQRAPRWLGDLLLRNQLPEKELGKISFVLQPFQDLLPGIASSDGNTRLTANRMLRARKVLSYVAERIEDLPSQPEPDALKPEEYLELYCQDQLIEHNMTLGTIRAHVWKSGGDVVLYYKSNGKKPSVEKLRSQRAAALSAAETSGKIGPSIPSTLP